MSKLRGGIMMGAGILISGVSGICTLFFIEEVFTNSAMIRPIVTLGVLPFLVGLALIWGGRRLVLRANEPTDRTDPPV
jgi:hypothetical protein